MKVILLLSCYFFPPEPCQEFTVLKLIYAMIEWIPYINMRSQNSGSELYGWVSVARPSMRPRTHTNMQH